MELKRRNNGIGLPEHRLPVMIPCSFLVPVGFFWYGWCAEAKTHWVLPNIGVVLFSAGIVVLFLSIQLYIMDSYVQYTASALASTIILRSIFGFTFPLFAPSMYEALGYGWGNSVLAFVALAVGVPAPILLWKLGPGLRARKTFAG